MPYHSVDLAIVIIFKQIFKIIFVFSSQLRTLTLNFLRSIITSFALFQIFVICSLFSKSYSGLKSYTICKFLDHLVISEKNEEPMKVFCYLLSFKIDLHGTLENRVEGAEGTFFRKE